MEIQNYTYNGKKIHVWTSPEAFVLTGGPGPVEYFVVAGGGAGGADMGGGGGGGGVLTGELTHLVHSAHQLQLDLVDLLLLEEVQLLMMLKEILVY